MPTSSTSSMPVNASTANSSAALVVADDRDGVLDVGQNGSSSVAFAGEGMSKRKRAAQTAFTVPRLICINAVVCGLDLCANAGFAYIPPILLKAGFSETVMSYIMGIGE